jgi:hypothetical protein
MSGSFYFDVFHSGRGSSITAPCREIVLAKAKSGRWQVRYRDNSPHNLFGETVDLVGMRKESDAFLNALAAACCLTLIADGSTTAPKTPSPEMDRFLKWASEKQPTLVAQYDPAP